MPPESASSIAQNPAAPVGERFDAQASAQNEVLKTLIPSAELQPVFDYIQSEFERQDLMKARSGANVIPFPSKGKADATGVRSVVLDEFQVGSQGDYWDRPGILGFDGMRSMVQQTPILSSIMLTRQRQVGRFCRPQTGRAQAGFVIEHTDPAAELGPEQRRSIKLLEKFIVNCGWEEDPRARKRLKRDSFAQFMAKSVPDTLTMDACPIETVFKRNRDLGLDGFVAVDGATIRLCTEQGYDGDDEIFALQVIQGQIRSSYNYDQLVYEVRNPRSDVTACGYGYSETEMLIKVITYLLNTMTFNGSFFDKNAIPRGFLQLFGNYSQEDLSAAKRYWNTMVSGIANAHNMPMLVSKDPGSKAEFVEIGGQMSEMAFGKWLSFLASVSCAIYGIAPEEISMESYATQGKGLGGDDTEEKLVSSSDKGLRPLLAFYESLFTDFIIRPFSPNYCLRFVGIDEEDAKQRYDARKLSSTFNEFRKAEGQDAIEGPLGDAPMNPTLISVWQQIEGIGQQQQPQEDFGDPDGSDGGQPGDAQDSMQPGVDASERGPGAGKPAPTGAGAPGKPPAGGDAPDFGSDMAKAFDFGLPPIYAFED